MKSFYALVIAFMTATVGTVVVATFAPAWAHDTATHSADAAEAVRAVMHGMFDRPEAELVIDPVVVDSGFAVAGWTQGEMGGRAFLREDGDHWTLVLCAGDEIRTAEALASSGVPPDVASSLAAAIVEAEKDLDPARLAQFASFAGLVMMDDGTAAH